jgi:two-component system LytT family response regulator
MTAHAPVRTVIVDDEPLARRRLRAMLAAEPGVEIVGEAGTGSAAVAVVIETRPDLLLLDIEMPGANGFDVLKQLAGIHAPAVVFVTAHDEHAIRAFDVQALDYVLKPVVEDRLKAAVRRAIARRREQDRENARIPVKTDRGVTLVPAADIHWLEADGDLVVLHAARGKHVLRTTMAEIADRLPGRQFVRVHRSAIVNIDAIQAIQPLFKGDYAIVLKTGATVRSGRTYRAAVQALTR